MVTSMLPDGRKARPQAFCRPEAMDSTLYFCVLATRGARVWSGYIGVGR